MKKTSLFLLLNFCVALIFGQNPLRGFQKFAAIQDSLCVAAYEKRDDKKYDKLYKEFTLKFNKLPDSTKQEYSNQYRNLQYNFCCLYSLQNNKALAMEYFEKSLKPGISDYYHILEDTDLDNIRNEAKFKSLVASLKSVSDYTFILNKAEKYNVNDNRSLPNFTYQVADDPSLVALRKAFNLDSVAGTGNDISKILNLMHWMHNLVPHNGSGGNPEIKNALSMIAVCKKERRGLNCRGMAMALNECYLSLGIKSRYVVCLPKDSLDADTDCHVINMVYSTSLKKWIWIDPTFDAYVMDETGKLLSIEEVRERIIDKKALILNPDANWNHQSSQTREYYLLQYMAKNLYKFTCSANSQYDTETTVPGKKHTYIHLLPLDDFRQTPDKSEKTNNTNSEQYINYKTNNPTLFWQVPE